MNKKREPKESEKKRPIDMTDEELIRSVFPPDVVDELKRIAAGEEGSDDVHNLSQEHDSR